jgi:cell division septal protein FtsQ
MDLEEEHRAGNDLVRRNMRFGWALFLLFWLIFAGTILVAVLYVQLD